MKTLYIECAMGAAGDMLMAALYELIPDKAAFIERLNSVGIPGLEAMAEPSVKSGITGTHMRIIVNGEEEESHDVHDHDRDHGHDHSHDHEHEHGHDHGHEHGHEHEHGHDHDHEHEHSHDHEHEHEHSHDHDHEHEHGHDHEHDHGHAHHHASVADIDGIIDALQVSDKVKADAKAVYGIIAEAEAHVHGRPVEQIHFHEVGTLDAVADVVGVCMLMEELAPQRVVASPVHVGSGSVRCMHGVLPVPAPATAYILRGIPMYGGNVMGELCTPTGAALLKYFAADFGPMPVLRTEAIGYGMGKKEFERANCVRAFIGE